MLALTLSLVLSASPDDGGDHHWSPNAARRHAGALIGAVLGTALPLLALPLADQQCRPGFSCFTETHSLLFASAAMLGSVGLTFGHALGDGSAPSFGATAIGAMMGALVSLGWIGLMGNTLSIDQREAAALVMTSTVPLTIALQLLALEFRHDALELQPARSVPWKRFGAAVGAGTLTYAAGVLSGLLMGLIFLPSNASQFIPVGLVLSVPLAPLAVTAGHRAFGGRGGFGAAYLGMLASGVVGAAIALVATFATSSVPFSNINFFAAMQGTAAAFGIGGIGIAALASSAIAVELSHAKQEEDEPAEKPASIELTFAPMPSGGAAVLSGRW